MKRNDLIQILPSTFQRTVREGNPLTAYLDVMEVLHQPCEHVLNTLDRYFDPRRAPDRFVPYLASWVDLQNVFDDRRSPDRPPISTGLERLRELTRRAAELSRWRGTAKGMLLFLATATGNDNFQIEENVARGAETVPFHIRVIAPVDLEIHRDLLRRIIEYAKPAYVTYTLDFAGEGDRRPA